MMIMTKSPLRISFTGGGTDYSNFYRVNGAEVVGSSINLSVYVFMLPLPSFAREKIRFTYRSVDSVLSASEIEHPVVRSLLTHLNWKEPVNIHTMADVPGNSGLGSSSAFTCGLIQALNAFAKHDISGLSLAHYSNFIERKILGEPGGIQDALHSSVGGLRSYSIDNDGAVVSTVLVPHDELESLSRYFSLVWIAGDRKSGDYSSSYDSSAPEKQRLLGEILNSTRRLSRELPKLVNSEDRAKVIWTAINENWILKRELSSQIVSENVHSVEKKLLENGFLVYKLCGAGGSGFMLIGHYPEEFERLQKLFPSGHCIRFRMIKEGTTTTKYP